MTSNTLFSSILFWALRATSMIGFVLALSTGPANAESRSYRIEFAPSPSSDAVGYLLHIGIESRSYLGELDMGDLPLSGGTLVYTLEASHSSDLFVALQAYDAAGRTSVFSNEERIVAEQAPAPAPEPGPAPSPGPGPTHSVGELLFFDSFDEYAVGADPVGWLDTGAGNSRRESSDLFDAQPAPDGGLALTTSSTETNIHSHFGGGDSGSWWNYEYSGRMMIEDATAGIGVTVLSDYPSSDRYLRIRRWAEGDSFRLSPHTASSTDQCVGTTNTGVVPRPDTWYWFRFRTFDEGAATRVLASVWEEGAPPPTQWQIDCLWSAWNEPTGRPGVWSRGPGRKMWDQVGAFTVDGPGESGGVVVNTASPLYAEDFETLALESDPAGWVDTQRNYSLVSEPTLFEVAAAPGGGRALVTRSGSTNIHSHYLGSNDEARDWKGYVYSGRMLSSIDTAGLGVTLYSDYPESDRYIRLRYWPGHAEFRISNRAPNGASCVGNKGTGVDRIPGRWYAFKLRAVEEGNDVRIQAKVWPGGQAEPAGWQADCMLADPAAFAGGGAPGVWSTGKGEKYWDDLVVEEVESGTP